LLPGQQPAEHRQGRHTGRARPDPLGPGQGLLGLENFLVLGVPRQAAAFAQKPERPLPLLSRIPGGQPFGHGVADLERADGNAVAPRPGDGVGAGSLGGDHERRFGDPA
jgi:hypothetical protein